MHKAVTGLDRGYANYMAAYADGHNPAVGGSVGWSIRQLLGFLALPKLANRQLMVMIVDRLVSWGEPFPPPETAALSWLLESVRSELTAKPGRPSVDRFDDFQQQAMTFVTDKHPGSLLYDAVELAGETGEVCEKIKKVVRDHGGVLSEDETQSLVKELGDVLWALAKLANDIDVPLSQVAQQNLAKLYDRQNRGKLTGSGDNR